MNDQRAPEPPGGAEDLATLVKGRSDDEINQAVAQFGEAQLLAMIFEGMSDRLVADRVAGRDIVVQWDIEALEGEHVYQLHIADGSCSVAAEQVHDSPSLVLGMSLPNFLRLISGELDGMQAFTSGQLQIGGNIALATELNTWFEQP